MTGKVDTVMAMDSARARTFGAVRLFSSLSVAAVIAFSIIFSQLLGPNSLQWQVAIALIALAIGIPHGAIDHLITLPRSKQAKMAIFITI